jgi:hypothetical protein
MAQSIVGTHLDETWNDRVATPTVAVYIDWSGDGDFDDAHEDVSSYVLNVSVQMGLLDEIYLLPVLGGVRAGSATITLANTGRFFSLTNASGIIGTYPALMDRLYGTKVRIEAGYYYGGAPERLVQFVGCIEGYEESETVDGSHITLRCRDMSFMLAQAKVYGPMWENYRTDEVISEILDLAGFPSSDRDLDAGMSEIPYSFVEMENALESCVAVANSEGGFFYMSKDGKATFRRITAPIERNSSPVVTINQGAIFRYSSALSWKDIYTRLVVEFDDYLDFQFEDVWKAGGYVEVKPGETRELYVKFNAPCLEVLTPVDGEDFYCVTVGGVRFTVDNGDISVSLDGYAADGILSLTNNHPYQTAYFIDLKIRGRPIRSSGTMRYIIDGSRPYRKELVIGSNNNPYVQSYDQAVRLGGYVWDQISTPLRVLEWEGPFLPWIELLDMVHLDHNTMTPNPGIDLDAFVMGYNISIGSGVARSGLTLVPKEDMFAYSDYFVIGTSVYNDSASDRVGY